jgi:opacity protein-like surface antigen
MKKIFWLIFALMMAITAESQTDRSPATASRTKTKRGFGEMSLSYLMLNNRESDNIHCAGMKFAGGFYPVSDLTRLGIEVGLQISVNRSPIGSFAYTLETEWETSSHDDGVIEREIVFVPILVSWDFEFGKETMFRIGPTIGLTPVSASNIYDPDADADKDYTNRQNKTPFVYGGNMELTFRLRNGLKLNFGYKYLRFTPFTFHDAYDGNLTISYDSPSTKMDLTGHQMSAGLLF